MIDHLISKKTKLAVVGLGYVGLPIALEFARKMSVIGYDIRQDRVALLRQGIDPSREMEPEAFRGKDIFFTHELEDLRQASFFVVAVPTPINENKQPDLGALLSASRAVGRVIKPGDYVVFESTVYPGCTEKDCVPLLEAESGLRMGTDFKVGYSPERINPGDKVHTLTTIRKVTSGCDAESSEQVARVYESIIEAGVFRASSIKVAEAAKIIENTQRDINIAFMNELSQLFDLMGINTFEVLEAASTKWNFLRFHPGLVGGHCIGVDPYYLAHKAKEFGYHAKIIEAGRAINDEMGHYVAKKAVKMMLAQDKVLQNSRMLVMGITFKENVSDIRNSKVADMVRELESFRVTVEVMDPHADVDEVFHEYGLRLVDSPSGAYDGIILAVSHKRFLGLALDELVASLRRPAIFVDFKANFRNHEMPEGVLYWSL